MLQQYLIIGAIMLALSGAGGFALKLYINEKTAHAVTQQSLFQVTNQLEKYEKDLEEMRVNQVALEGKNLDITLQLREDTRTLEGLRGREATVLKAKTHVSLRINKAFQKRQRELACLTGDIALCEN